MTPSHLADAAGADDLVCADALHRLVDQVGEAAAVAFVNRFVNMWPLRRQRLHLAIEQHDSEQGQDAALSLCSGAAMAGAYRLAELGTQLGASIPETTRSPAWCTAAGILHELDRLGAESVADVARLARNICPGGPGRSG